jgi:hypothetical protein
MTWWTLLPIAGCLGLALLVTALQPAVLSGHHLDPGLRTSASSHDDVAMPAVEAWFQDGPADGALLAVETRADGTLPDVMALQAAGVYVGASDQRQPAVEHIYLLVDDLGNDAVYRYNRREADGV